MTVINTNQLNSALERLCLVVPKRATMPVLENFRWRIVKGRLELTATDLDNSLQIHVPLAVPSNENAVDVLVPARELHQLIKTESAPTLEIRIRDKKFEVHANHRTLILSCAEPQHFPELPDGELNARGEVLSSALDTALEKTLFCVSAESGRYSIDVLKLELRDSVFRLIGTDGHRLSLVEGAARKKEGNGSYSSLLLRSTASIMKRLQVSDRPGWTQFSTLGSAHEFSQFLFHNGCELIARRGVGQFPNYENVLPKTPLEARVVFQRDELLDGLAKLSATARKAPNAAVKFELSKRPAGIKSEAEGAENRIALEHIRISGKARDIGFNHEYLTQYVKSLETDTVSMKLFPKAISEAALFDSFRYQHLLMPLRD